MSSADNKVDSQEELSDEQKKKLEELKKRAKEAGIRSREEALALAQKESVPAELQTQSLQTAIFTILKTNPFMGSVLQCMNITYSHVLPTAGVMFNNEIKRWDLLINPHFFCKQLNEKHRKAVLLHELYHITHKHPLRIPFMNLSTHKRRLMNIAMDMAINQYITDLPDGCEQCPPRQPGEFAMAPCPNPDCCGSGIFIKDFFDVDAKTGKQIPWDTRRTAEYYYEKLIQRFKDPDPADSQNGDSNQDGDSSDENGKKGKGSSGSSNPSNGGNSEKDKNNGNKGPGNAGGGADSDDLPKHMDVHHWDGSTEEKDMLEATEDLVKRAMIKCRFGYDELPGFVKELLDHIKQRKAELDYKRLILQAMKSSLPANFRVKSWTRKSRRFGNKAPGNKNGEKPKLDNFIDTSGSISIEEANNFLDIVDEFLKVGAKKCVLNLFHTRNYYREDYKRGQKLKREDFESGGTCLQESMEIIARERPDLAIILTDGHYNNVDTKRLVGNNGKFPNTVFIISPDGTTEHPFKKESWATTVQIPKGK